METVANDDQDGIWGVVMQATKRTRDNCGVAQCDEMSEEEMRC